MQKTANDEQKMREHLKTRRNLLLEEYFHNPTNTQLAIEIKLIDDQVAELTEQLVYQRKSGLV